MLIRQWYIFIYLYFLCFNVFAYDCQKPHVIYFTLDGIAPYEVTKEHFPFVYSSILDKSKHLGLKGDSQGMTVASIPMSLPSYQSQMVGEVQTCKNNKCGRVTQTTIPEEIKHYLKLSKYDVATFSSWNIIKNAAEHIKGSTLVSAGNEIIHVPFIDDTFDQLQKQQSKDVVFWDPKDRADKNTFSIAMKYLSSKHPAFLWISLDDGDEYAHLSRRPEFDNTLHGYDNNIKHLTKLIKTDKCLAKNTWVIITTDHGRGLTKNWSEHGLKYPISKNTWALIFHSQNLLKAIKVQIPYDLSKKNYSTLMIKPLVEALFGKDVA